MSKEEDLIRKMATYYSRSKDQLNEIYESDSEIIDFFGSKLLINIDEFSTEDHLREHDPFSLGWNVATGSMSDIFATGGKPLFAGHNLVAKRDWSEEYILEFNRGVAAALKKAGVDFIGGDFGFGDVWRYTGTVLGVPMKKPVMRSGAKVGDQIFITGEIGMGNVEALLMLMGGEENLGGIGEKIVNQFPLRQKEARLVSEYASACIDTSDGAYNCINTIAEQSRVGFEIENLPLLEIGRIATKRFNIPSILLFLAEAGEYELIFTVGEEKLEEFLNESENEDLQFTGIGRITDGQTKILKHEDKVYDLSNFTTRARDFDSVKDYIKELVLWVRRHDG